MSDDDMPILCQLDFTNNNCEGELIVNRDIDEIKQLAILIFLKDDDGWFCKDHNDQKWAMLSSDTQQSYIKIAILICRVKDMI